MPTWLHVETALVCMRKHTATAIIPRKTQKNRSQPDKTRTTTDKTPNTFDPLIKQPTFVRDLEKEISPASHVLIGVFVTIWFFVKTNDPPQTVGETVCAYNIFEDAHPKGRYSWIIQPIEGEEETWRIQGKYEQVHDLSNVAMVYRAGDTVVLGEIGDDFVPNFLDPLLTKYGFDNLKWVVAVPKVKNVSRWPIAP
jgi:hypothetical protein